MSFATIMIVYLQKVYQKIIFSRHNYRQIECNVFFNNSEYRMARGELQLFQNL